MAEEGLDAADADELKGVGGAFWGIEGGLCVCGRGGGDEVSEGGFGLVGDGFAVGGEFVPELVIGFAGVGKGGYAA